LLVKEDSMKRNFVVLGMGLTVVALVAFIGANLLAEGSGATYVGSKKCKKCHLKIHKNWAKRGHAKAMEKIKDEDLDKTCEVTKKKCLACHVTGFGKEGGWKSKDETPGLAEVGCEACHGPGSDHIAISKGDLKKLKEAKGDLKIKMAEPEACVFCHNPHISYKELYGE